MSENTTASTIGSDPTLGDRQILARWAVPGINDGDTTDLEIAPGDVLAVVGPNGSGKSALSHWLSQSDHISSTNGRPPVTRILAHRRVWLESAGSEMPASQRANTVQSIGIWDSAPTSRFRIDGDQQRSSVLLYDLATRVNARNARVAELYGLFRFDSG